MAPKILLRLASVFLSIFFLGHTLGGMVFGKTRGPEEDAVLGALGAYRFQIMGFTRSHHDFYVGEGWYLSLALLVVIVLTCGRELLFASSMTAVARASLCAPSTTKM